jgi:drug/metabolite transporter (DMT)-like permease
VVLTLLAGLLSSCGALLVKLTGGRIPVLQICLFRSSISLAVTLAVASYLRVKPLYGHPNNLTLLLLRGGLGTLSVISSFASYLLLPLGDAATVAQLKQPVAAIIARLALGEPLGTQGSAGCGLSMAGVVALAHPPFLFGGKHWTSTRLLGMACGLCFTLASAGVAATIRRIGRSEHTLTIALWFHTSVTLFTGVAILADVQEEVLPHGHDWLLLCAIALTTFLSQLATTRALQQTAVATVAGLNFLTVIYGHVLGTLVLHEAATPGGLVGGIIILAGVLLVVLRPKAPKTPGATAVAGCAPVGIDEQSGSSIGVDGKSGGELLSAGQVLVEVVAEDVPLLGPGTQDSCSTAMEPLLRGKAAGGMELAELAKMETAAAQEEVEGGRPGQEVAWNIPTEPQPAQLQNQGQQHLHEEEEEEQQVLDGQQGVLLHSSPPNSLGEAGPHLRRSIHLEDQDSGWM